MVICASLPTSVAAVDFVGEVQPIFAQHCVGCHGESKQKSGLRLDIKSEAFKGGDGYGPAVVEGDADASPIIELVTSDDPEMRMPPGNHALSVAEVDVLTRWIREGAVWPDGVDHAKLQDRTDHWSFKPLAPQASRSIDDFIDERLAASGLQMSPPADRGTWLRRVHFDLIGLPPSPDAIDSFQRDQSPDAYQRVVDRLLQSPRYGERWAQHWLDVVRYADTDGFEVNTPRPNAWPYRDYVIDAINRDLSYDQFVREQLAGDAYATNAATGFLVTAAALLPGQIGKDDESIRLARQDSLAEIIINTSEAFLGLSIGCARCHDHKFDAISQRDYYALQAFFAGVQYGERPITNEISSQKKLELESARSQLKRVRGQVDELRNSLGLRATNARLNEETFAPVQAKWVRLTIHDANHHPSLGLIEPCIDELEIFTDEPTPRNVALASEGATVTASGSRISAPHRLEHLNDGKYGNSHSWMSDEKGRGWVMIELAEPMTINRVVWGRDREGKFEDRLATVITLEAASEPDNFQHLAGIELDRLDQWTSLNADDGLLAQQTRIEKSIKRLEQLPMVFAGKFTSPEMTYVLSRGDPEQPLDLVPPAVPAALGDTTLESDSPEQSRRVALAQWIADPGNPLTPRVAVNRIWQGHFGIGIVATPSDFGRSGARPSHPELLDWLAAEFIRSGWSSKHLHRLIVLSKTYRQSSELRADAVAIDGETRLLWRYPTRRLEAESIRDTMLAVSGRLNLTTGGPGFNLFQSHGGLSGFPPVESFTGDGLRRMIYSHKIRMERESVFGAFDCPDAGQSMPRRLQSTTPIQALNLFNSRFTIEQSDAFAMTVKSLTSDDAAEQVDTAFRLALGRRPSADETEWVLPVVRQHGLPTLCRVLFNSNEFLFLP